MFNLSQIQICNLALKRISVRPINAITDQTPAAQSLKTVWDMAVYSVLRTNDWNFATKIVPLTLLANEMVIGWNYLYAYPPDCVMAWKVCDANSVQDQNITYDWEALLSPTTSTYSIASNLENAYLRYTSGVTDITKWDAAFADALAWRLAIDISQESTGDSGNAARCSQFYAQAIAAAQTMNKTEKNNPTTPDSPYIDIRGSGGTAFYNNRNNNGGNW